MRLSVRLYATLCRYRPGLSAGMTTDVDAADNATVSDLIDQLGLPTVQIKVVFVNGRARPPEWILQPGDEVGIFPPVGGG